MVNNIAWLVDAVDWFTSSGENKGVRIGGATPLWDIKRDYMCSPMSNCDDSMREVWCSAQLIGIDIRATKYFPTFE